MNHRLLNLIDLIMVKNNVCFSQHVIIMDLLDLIMDLLDHYWIILDSHMKTPGVVFILCNQHSMV